MYYYVGSAWFPAVWTSPLLPNSFLPFVCFLFISITLLCMEPFAVLTALLLWIQMFELLFLIRLHVEVFIFWSCDYSEADVAILLST